MVKVTNTDEMIPGLSEELVAWLEATFPVRCLGETENVAVHHRYAGKVDLIASLRLHLDAMIPGSDSTLAQLAGDPEPLD